MYFGIMNKKESNMKVSLTKDGMSELLYENIEINNRIKSFLIRSFNKLVNSNHRQKEEDCKIVPAT